MAAPFGPFRQIGPVPFFGQQLLHLDAGEDERWNALEIVFDDRLADVVFESAVARPPFRRGESEPGHRAALDEIQPPVLAGAQQIAQDTCVPLFHRGQIFFARQVAAVDSLGQRVNEHARSGGFAVIALTPPLV